MGKPGVPSGTGTKMRDALCRLMGDHPLPLNPSGERCTTRLHPSSTLPLLSMEAAGLGLLCNLNKITSVYLDADDIRTVATSLSTLEGGAQGLLQRCVRVGAFVQYMCIVNFAVSVVSVFL